MTRFRVPASMIVLAAFVLSCSASNNTTHHQARVLDSIARCPAAIKAEDTANAIVRQVHTNKRKADFGTRTTVYDAFMHEETAFAKCADAAIEQQESAMFSLLAGMSASDAVKTLHSYRQPSAVARARTIGESDYKRALMLFTEDARNDKFYRFTEKQLKDIERR